MDQQRRRADDEAPEQTWGQGEGEHEPTIPEDDAESSTTPTYSEGTATYLGEPGSLAREDEGMDR
ncbi:MAG: hypothetical protein ACRDFY_05100 [Candidatus Limnocylindria bacterium]